MVMVDDYGGELWCGVAVDCRMFVVDGWVVEIEAGITQ